MKYAKTIVAILAVFMVMMSAAAVFADDDVVLDDDAGLSPVAPVTGDGGPQVADDVADTADGGEDQQDQGDETSDDDESEDEEEDPDENVTDEDDEDGIYLDSSANATASSAEITQQSVSGHATGNPIVVLLAALAVLGICPFKK